MNNSEAFQRSAGYRFHDPGLLDEAFTHSSARSGNDRAIARDNERLEFLGDAYLDAVVGRMLFEALPDAPEGELTRRRAQIVCERNLASIGRKLCLGEHLVLGRGEENHGGRDKDSILADALEALIGAIAIDGGYEEAEAFVRRCFAGSLEDSLNGLLFSDHKSEFQERLQKKNGGLTPCYRVVEESGPDHDKTFRVILEVKGVTLGEGLGKSTKEAEQEAERDALRKESDNVF